MMASTQAFPRLFTVDEANGLLPALRPLMEQISNNLDSLKKSSATVIREEQLSPDSPDLMHRLQKDDAIAQRVAEVKDLVGKINSYGCLCKGVEQGLVDFPCQLGEEIVYLCWRHDEERVVYWHRAEDGFAGRRLLLDSDEGDGSGYVSYH